MLQFQSFLEKLIPLPPLPYDNNNTPQSAASTDPNQYFQSRCQNKPSKQTNNNGNGYKYKDRPARLCSKQKNVVNESEIISSEVFAEESVIRSQYEVIVTSGVGLGIDWHITKSGLVYVRGFRRVNNFYCSEVEIRGAVQVTDELISINDTELKSLDRLRIYDWINALDKLAKNGVRLIFRYADIRLPNNSSTGNEEKRQLENTFENLMSTSSTRSPRREIISKSKPVYVLDHEEIIENIRSSQLFPSRARISNTPDLQNIFRLDEAYDEFMELTLTMQKAQYSRYFDNASSPIYRTPKHLFIEQVDLNNELLQGVPLPESILTFIEARIESSVKLLHFLDNNESLPTMTSSKVAKVLVLHPPEELLPEKLRFVSQLTKNIPTLPRFSSLLSTHPLILRLHQPHFIAPSHDKIASLLTDSSLISFDVYTTLIQWLETIREDRQTVSVSPTTALIQTMIPRSPSIRALYPMTVISPRMISPIHPSTIKPFPTDTPFQRMLSSNGPMNMKFPIHISTKLPVQLPPMDITYCIYYILIHFQQQLLYTPLNKQATSSSSSSMNDEFGSNDDEMQIPVQFLEAYQDINAILIIKLLDKWCSIMKATTIWEIIQKQYQMNILQRLYQPPDTTTSFPYAIPDTRNNSFLAQPFVVEQNRISHDYGPYIQVVYDLTTYVGCLKALSSEKLPFLSIHEHHSMSLPSLETIQRYSYPTATADMSASASSSNPIPNLEQYQLVSSKLPLFYTPFVTLPLMFHYYPLSSSSPMNSSTAAAHCEHRMYEYIDKQWGMFYPDMILHICIQHQWNTCIDKIISLLHTFLLPYMKDIHQTMNRVKSHSNSSSSAGSMTNNNSALSSPASKTSTSTTLASSSEQKNTPPRHPSSSPTPSMSDRPRTTSNASSSSNSTSSHHVPLDPVLYTLLINSPFMNPIQWMNELDRVVLQLLPLLGKYSMNSILLYLLPILMIYNSSLCIDILLHFCYPVFTPWVVKYRLLERIPHQLISVEYPSISGKEEENDDQGSLQGTSTTVSSIHTGHEVDLMATYYFQYSSKLLRDERVSNLHHAHTHPESSTHAQSHHQVAFASGNYLIRHEYPLRHQFSFIQEYFDENFLTKTLSTQQTLVNEWLELAFYLSGVQVTLPDMTGASVPISSGVAAGATTTTTGTATTTNSAHKKRRSKRDSSFVIIRSMLKYHPDNSYPHEFDFIHAMACCCQYSYWEGVLHVLQRWIHQSSISSSTLNGSIFELIEGTEGGHRSRKQLLFKNLLACCLDCMLSKYIDMKLSGWRKEVHVEQITSTAVDEEETHLQLIQRYVTVMKILLEHIMLSNPSLWNEWQQSVLVDPMNKAFLQLANCAVHVPNASLYLYKHDVENFSFWISRVLIKVFGWDDCLVQLLQRLPAVTQYLPTEYVLKVINRYE